MPIEINSKILRESAEIVLKNAYIEASDISYSRSSEFKEMILKILHGNHKTYRYILFTALLAKASNENINPLALQAKSKLPGAYDARSLCHSVVVPFEQKYLGNAMGGSNEPYLNKPARFEEISIHNPVRTGRDQELLFLLHDELKKINSSSESYDALVFAIRVLISIRDSHVTIRESASEISGKGKIDALKLIDLVLDSPMKGESLNLMVASFLKCFFANDPTVEIEVHKINQSGASSKEISDLDIYKNGKILSTYELKDKDFSSQDIMHAVEKSRNAGVNSLNFISGRNANWDLSEVKILREELFSDGFILNLIDVDNFILTLINLIEDLSFEEFLEAVDTSVEESNASDLAVSRIKEIVESLQ